MDNAVEPAMSLERIFLENKILTDALQENPGLTEIEVPKLKSLVKSALLEIDQFEQAAKQPNLPQTAEEARKIKAIWCFSGPGTYDLPFKEDRYKDKPWARFMDRRRLNYSAWLMRKITEISLGRRLDGVKDLQVMAAAIRQSGPYLIYNGREDENETVRSILAWERVAIPREKVYIIDAGIDRTIDQIKSFHLPEGLEFKPEDRLALVSHAPHLMRILHIINEVKPFPEGTEIQVFPIPTPSDGRYEYAEMETRGLLYSTFISKEAKETPSPYLL